MYGMIISRSFALAYFIPLSEKSGPIRVRLLKKTS